MPSLSSFVSAFGLKQGAEIGGYVITGVHGRENTIKRYHEYSFDIDVTLEPFHPNATLRKLFSQVDGDILSQVHSIKAITNYYICSLSLLNYQQNGKNVTLYLKGMAIRE